MKVITAFLAFRFPALIGLISLLLTAPDLFAGSATWKSSPPSSDWNFASNWSPKTVPNGPSDLATFAVSNTGIVNISTATEVNGITFATGASNYSIEVPAAPSAPVLTISGIGIANNSGASEAFVAQWGADFGSPTINFTGSAAAGSNVTYTAQGGTAPNTTGGRIQFFGTSTADHGAFLVDGSQADGAGSGDINFQDTSTAGNGVFTNAASSVSGSVGGGVIFFFGDSSAGSGTFTNQGGALSGSVGGGLIFFQNSTAALSKITAGGGTASGAVPGQLAFVDNSTAASAILRAGAGRAPDAEQGVIAFLNASSAGLATITAQDGTPFGAPGGLVNFYDDSTGDSARVRLFGNATVDMSWHNPAFMSFGSIEGSGLIHIGGIFLEVGFNNLSTTFSGVIDPGPGDETGGILFKEGTGTLTLSGANTYGGGTAIDAGTLLVTTKGASPTGTSDVSVNQGTLGGTSTLAGGIILGTGAGEGAFLAPGVNGAGTLSTRKTLQFGGNSTYLCQVDTKKKRSDSVSAKGVTILSGTTFALSAIGQRPIPPGTIFTVINNTSRSPIAGTFANLADHSTVNVNGNTFEADYEGGDGNDLTLTVQP